MSKRADDRPKVTTDPADERRRAEHVIAAQLSRSWADRQESLRRAHSIVTALDGAGYTVAPKVGALFPHKGMTPEQVAQWRERCNAAVRAPQAATEPATAPPGPGAAQDATDGSAAESEPHVHYEIEAYADGWSFPIGRTYRLDDARAHEEPAVTSASTRIVRVTREVIH